MHVAALADLDRLDITPDEWNEVLAVNLSGVFHVAQATARHMVAKGSGVIIFTSVIHHDPRYWENPERFIPERFLERPMGQDHLFAWLPFGSGRRACIARHFSPLEILVALVLLARNLSFEQIPDRPVKPHPLGPGLLTQPSEAEMILRKL